MSKLNIKCVLILLHFMAQSAAIIFTIPHKLASVFIAEEIIIKVLQSKQYQSYLVAQYLDFASNRIGQVPLLDGNVSPDIMEKHLETVLEELVGNPLHVYSLVARVTQILPKLTKEDEQIRRLVENNIDGTLLIDNARTELPNHRDLVGVTFSITRIQFVYRYDPVELSRGIIEGVSTAARLSVTDMMYIAGLCYEHKYFATALEWAEAAQRISSQESIIKFINKIKAAHDLSWKSPDGETYPNEEFFAHRFGSEDITGRELRMKEGSFLTGSEHIFYRLCRGEKVDKREVDDNSLEAGGENVCKLTSLGVPYLMLAPVRLEELSNQPTLHVFHQVLSQEEINLLKFAGYQQGFDTASTGDLENEDVNEDDSGEIEESDEEEILEVDEDQEEEYSEENEGPERDIRIQANVWLPDEDDPEFHKLSQKTGEMTRLECAKNSEQLANTTFHTFDPAEPFQVGVYPPGGHYSAHHDSHEDDEPALMFKPAARGQIWAGNRVATLMYYLSNVKGGRTAFPNLGISVAPEKGSAVFWFNLDGRGARENLAVHGACPTTLGIKWVSNKWISEGAQIWRRPCTK